MEIKEKEIKIKNKIKIQYNLLIKNQKLSVTTSIILFEIKMSNKYEILPPPENSKTMKNKNNLSFTKN